MSKKASSVKEGNGGQRKLRRSKNAAAGKAVQP